MTFKSDVSPCRFGDVNADAASHLAWQLGFGRSEERKTKRLYRCQAAVRTHPSFTAYAIGNHRSIIRQRLVRQYASARSTTGSQRPLCTTDRNAAVAP